MFIEVMHAGIHGQQAASKVPRLLGLSLAQYLKSPSTLYILKYFKDILIQKKLSAWKVQGRSYGSLNMAYLLTIRSSLNIYI